MEGLSLSAFTTLKGMCAMSACTAGSARAAAEAQHGCHSAACWTLRHILQRSRGLREAMHECSDAGAPPRVAGGQQWALKTQGLPRWPAGWVLLH